MFIQSSLSSFKKSQIAFAAGLCLVIVSGWIHIFPSIRTVMFTWRVELAASIFIAVVSVYFLYGKQKALQNLKLTKQEIHFIVLPLTTFILWSGVSTFWGYSWKSTLHHTAFWSIYLIFYIVVRKFIEINGGYQLLMTLLILLLLLIGIPAIIEYCSFLYLNAGTTLGIRFSKYAEIVNLLLPLLIASVVRLKKRQFVIGALCVAAMWLFIISTLSRTAFILFIAGVLLMTGTIFVFRQFKKYRRKISLLILILIITPLPIHLIGFISPEPGIPLLNRVNDSAGISNSNNSRKLLATVAFEMFKMHPLTGIGADNFGVELNNYRAAYGEKNSTDINLVTGESEIAERAHNEYLQIISELGSVGILIFLCFLTSVALMTFSLFKKCRSASLFPFAAICGIILFLISSVVSSYSFRLMQNGLIFFFVLAVAAKFLCPKKEHYTPAKNTAFANKFYKAAFGIAILSCIMLGTQCILRAASSYYSEQLLNLSDGGSARSLYEKAVRFDNENPRAYLGYGLYLINEKRYSEAVPELSKSIKFGEGTSASYSLLSTAQFLSGDVKEACETFATAVKLYPHSTFVRTRYAFLLKAAGSQNEAEKQLEISSTLDLKSTKTWWSLMHEGVAKTNLKTLTDEDYLIVFDLQPQISYTALMVERLILHPGEKPNIKLLSEN